MRNPHPKLSKTGAENVGSIGDLLIQIFVHLPLKPLIRFKSVSKQWNSIISDPKFPFTRRQLHNNRAVGLILQKDYWNNPQKETRVVPFDRSSSNAPPQIHIPHSQRIFGSCNGLLVLKRTARHYSVYNYTDQKITPLRKDENARPRDKVHGMYLAFDPSVSPHYKVVCVWELDWLTKHTPQYQFEVYSSETGSWETRGVDTGCVDFDDGVFWNGAIHWVGFYYGKSIYFNPDHDEMPRVMPTPPFQHGFRKNPGSYCFGESFDHLHCAVVGKNVPWIYVYEMRRDYSEWFLKYRVDGYSQCLPNYRVQSLFCVVRGKRDEDSFLVWGTLEGEIVRYNLVHNTFQTIQVKDLERKGCRTKSFQYI